MFSTEFPLRSLNLNPITYLIVSKLSINQNIPIIVPFPPSYKKRGCYVPMFWALRNCALMLLNDFPLTWPFFCLSLSSSFYFLSVLCFFFALRNFSPIPSSIISLVTRWRLWVCILGGGSRLQRQWIRRRAPSGLTNEFRVRASPVTQPSLLMPSASCSSFKRLSADATGKDFSTSNRFT